MKPRYFLSIIAILKNEGRYLREWLEYHRMIGVEHFYIGNHDSTDDTGDILKEYEQAGIATVFPLTGPRQQGNWYKRAIQLLQATEETTWAAIIDGDEFLVDHGSHDLESFLAGPRMESAPALQLHWRNFGSNGHVNYSNKLVIERFTRREARVNPHVKTICRPECVQSIPNVHAFTYRDGALAVDERGFQQPSGNPYPEGGTADIFSINHYVVKSVNECKTKCARGCADGAPNRIFETFFPEHDRNEVEDRDICRYIPELKRRLKNAVT